MEKASQRFLAQPVASSLQESSVFCRKSVKLTGLSPEEASFDVSSSRNRYDLRSLFWESSWARWALYGCGYFHCLFHRRSQNKSVPTLKSLSYQDDVGKDIIGTMSIHWYWLYRKLFTLIVFMAYETSMAKCSIWMSSLQKLSVPLQEVPDWF